MSATTPTQVAHPGAAVKRTSLAAIISSGLGLAVVAPEIVNIILEEAGETMPADMRVALIGVGVGVVIVTAIITRIMAIPAVNAVLTKISFGATSSKKKGRYAK
jgi:hypothetical protein